MTHVERRRALRRMLTHAEKAFAAVSHLGGSETKEARLDEFVTPLMHLIIRLRRRRDMEERAKLPRKRRASRD